MRVCECVYRDVNCCFFRRRFFSASQLYVNVPANCSTILFFSLAYVLLVVDLVESDYLHRRKEVSSPYALCYKR